MKEIQINFVMVDVLTQPFFCLIWRRTSQPCGYSLCIYLLKAFMNYYQNFLVTVRKTTETIMAFSARGFYKRVGKGVLREP